jgi:hypothetical protein
MSRTFQTIEGTAGIRDTDVAHLILPGRGRGLDGMSITSIGEQRVATAAEFYIGHMLLDQGGVVVCSGYKTPSDNLGEPWRDQNGIEYMGIPESYSMKSSLIENHQIPEASIRTEAQSIDTVTNFTNSQSLFPDDRPIGIVSQEQHLERIMKVIAPRTIRQDYIGIVVPELPGEVDIDSLPAKVASLYIAWGLKPYNKNSSEIAEKRAIQIWRTVLAIKSLSKSLTGNHKSTVPYNTN